jgi:hypothetical protein
LRNGVTQLFLTQYLLIGLRSKGLICSPKPCAEQSCAIKYSYDDGGGISSIDSGRCSYGDGTGSGSGHADGNGFGYKCGWGSSAGRGDGDGGGSDNS